MRTSLYAIAIAALALGWSTTAHAQAEHYTNKPIEINLHGGGIAIDDGDTEPLLGARIAYNLANGFGIEGAFDWTQQTEEFGGDEFTTTGYLYNASLTYTFPSPNQLHFFASAGVGAATSSPDEDLEELGFESTTELAIPVGGGVKWFNQTNDPTWGIRGDVKDHIVMGSDEEVGGVEFEGETTHNFEFSAGVSFFLGGGM